MLEMDKHKESIVVSYTRKDSMSSLKTISFMKRSGHAQTLHLSPLRHSTNNLMVRRPRHRRTNSGDHLPRTLRRNAQLQLCERHMDMEVVFAPESVAGASDA